MTTPAAGHGRPVRPRRRSRLWWVLVLLLIVVPLAEIFVLIQVGQVIGAWWTIGLLVADSILGSWLIRREGGRAWTALTTALSSGRMPARELADGGLILVGGTLMLSPGFVTDAVGMLLILPFTRPLARALLTRLVARRLLAASSGRPPAAGFAGGFPGGSPGSGFPGAGFPGAGFPGAGRPRGRGEPGSSGGGTGQVVPGEVVDDDRPPDSSAV